MKLLLFNFQFTITLPVPSPEKMYLHYLLRYNIMLAWIGRVNRFLQEPWVSCSRNLLNLCYDADQKGLNRFFCVLKQTGTLKNFLVVLESFSPVLFPLMLFL